MADNSGAIPSTRQQVIDDKGFIQPPWYRYLARFQQTAQVIEAGGGLSFSGNIIFIPSGGVTSAMLRDSVALSVIGRQFNSDGAPSDIIAANNRTMLGRQADQLGFYDTASVRAVDTQTLTLGVRGVAASATFGFTDYLITADATGGAVTLTLPDRVTGRTVSAKKTDAGVNTVTLSGDANIDGSATKVLLTQYASVTLVAGASEWHVVA